LKKLQSQRLFYKPIQESDYDFIRFYLSDPERTRYLPLEKPYPEEKVKEWLAKRLSHWQEKHFGSFIINEKRSRKMIGFCGLEYAKDPDYIDIRYGLVQEVWGNGYAFEAASYCIKYGFEVLGLEIIYGAAVPQNKPSIHILKKIGMTPDTTFNFYGNVVDPYSIHRMGLKSDAIFTL
jgi:RimJ/RimL family protein N-acetyltransferase